MSRVSHKSWYVEFREGKVMRKSDMIPYKFNYTPTGIELDGPGKDTVPEYVVKFIKANAADELSLEFERGHKR